ncbi:hypothetical protein ES705_27832 [subsurface metagenome]
MNLEKAIEILQQDWNSQETGEQSDYQDAVRLGIEALKTIKEMRYESVYDGTTQLPGETKK